MNFRISPVKAGHFPLGTPQKTCILDATHDFKPFELLNSYLHSWHQSLAIPMLSAYVTKWNQTWPRLENPHVLQQIHIASGKHIFAMENQH